jgi:hypothetical protein
MTAPQAGTTVAAMNRPNDRKSRTGSERDRISAYNGFANQPERAHREQKRKIEKHLKSSTTSPLSASAGLAPEFSKNALYSRKSTATVLSDNTAPSINNTVDLTVLDSLQDSFSDRLSIENICGVESHHSCSYGLIPPVVTSMNPTIAASRDELQHTSHLASRVSVEVLLLADHEIFLRGGGFSDDTCDDMSIDEVAHRTARHILARRTRSSWPDLADDDSGIEKADEEDLLSPLPGEISDNDALPSYDTCCFRAASRLNRYHTWRQLLVLRQRRRKTPIVCDESNALRLEDCLQLSQYIQLASRRHDFAYRPTPQGPCTFLFTE